MKALPSPCKGGCSAKYDAWHLAYGRCRTKLCSGWVEFRCGACGWYTVECLCGVYNRQSKISMRAWKAIAGRQRNKRSET